MKQIIGKVLVLLMLIGLLAVSVSAAEMPTVYLDAANGACR